MEEHEIDRTKNITVIQVGFPIHWEYFLLISLALTDELAIEVKLSEQCRRYDALDMVFRL